MVRSGRSKPLPVASTHLLLALLHGENHGYALMRLVEEHSGGAVRMGPGTLYGTLSRLLADGLIGETTDDVVRSGLERRRYYRLTAAGARVAGLELDMMRRVVDRFRAVPGLGGANA